MDWVVVSMGSSKVNPEDLSEVSAVMACLSSCCCQEFRPRSEVNDWMILSSNAEAQPSLLQRCCLCQCAPDERVNNGIDSIPQISSLAGATLQAGEHSTGGSVQTLKWCRFDKEQRVAQLQVFGGFGGRSSTGLWTEPPSYLWICAINVARLCNYSYKFEFSEDWRHADIKIKGNCTGCLFPCCPACVQVPDCLAKFDMTQQDDSTDGRAWIRASSTCGGPMKESYRLLEVYKPDGSDGAYLSKLTEFAPTQMLLSR